MPISSASSMKGNAYRFYAIPRPNFSIKLSVPIIKARFPTVFSKKYKINNSSSNFATTHHKNLKIIQNFGCIGMGSSSANIKNMGLYLRPITIIVYVKHLILINLLLGMIFIRFLAWWWTKLWTIKSLTLSIKSKSCFLISQSMKTAKSRSLNQLHNTLSYFPTIYTIILVICGAKTAMRSCT